MLAEKLLTIAVIKCGTTFSCDSYHHMSDVLSNAQVLIVDDDVFERMGASYMFSDAGYRVFEAGSADEALQFLESISDIRLVSRTETCLDRLTG